MVLASKDGKYFPDGLREFTAHTLKYIFEPDFFNYSLVIGFDLKSLFGLY